jgi:hypothetical protein
MPVDRFLAEKQRAGDGLVGLAGATSASCRRSVTIAAAPKVGRPPKLQADEETLRKLENLGKIRCTTKEAAAVLDVSEPTSIFLSAIKRLPRRLDQPIATEHDLVSAQRHSTPGSDQEDFLIAFSISRRSPYIGWRYAEVPAEIAVEGGEVAEPGIVSECADRQMGMTRIGEDAVYPSKP